MNRSDLEGAARALMNENSAPGVGKLTIRRVCDIEAQPISWLWRPRIARGKLTMIAGDPGLGKSQITASIAAVVTTGGRWPIDRSDCESGDVIFLSAEDDPADTLRPRLEASGADLRRVHFIDGVLVGFTGEGARKDRAFSLQQDLDALDAALRGLGGVAAVVIDPISAYLGNTDSHNNADVRALLSPLSELASRHKVAILAVSHLNKMAKSQALARVTGSLAFVAAARAAYVVTVDPADPERRRRLFLPMKNNIGPDAGGLAFHIEPATVQTPAGPLPTSRIMWEAEVSITAEEAMQPDESPTGRSELEDAMAWLEENLADGPVASLELNKRADTEGIKLRTLRRAKERLGIKSGKTGMTGGWTCSLPSKMAKLPEDGHAKTLDTFGDDGHLRTPGMVEMEL